MTQEITVWQREPETANSTRSSVRQIMYTIGGAAITFISAIGSSTMKGVSVRKLEMNFFSKNKKTTINNFYLLQQEIGNQSNVEQS